MDSMGLSVSTMPAKAAWFVPSRDPQQPCESAMAISLAVVRTPGRSLAMAGT
jgi:hypothetical protein